MTTSPPRGPKVSIACFVMFIRQQFRTKNGQRHTYWALVESYRTAEHPAGEFQAMAHAQVTGALLVDAGLNLNGRDFDQLEIAAERIGFL